MKIIIHLPQSTGFDVEIDNQLIHSKYEDITIKIFLTKGEHTLSATDQAPTPTFWNKIIGFLNTISQSNDNFSDETTFETATDLEASLSVKYGEYDCVEFLFEEE